MRSASASRRDDGSSARHREQQRRDHGGIEPGGFHGQAQLGAHLALQDGLVERGVKRHPRRALGEFQPVEQGFVWGLPGACSLPLMPWIRMLDAWVDCTCRSPTSRLGVNTMRPVRSRPRRSTAGGRARHPGRRFRRRPRPSADRRAAGSDRSSVAAARRAARLRWHPAPAGPAGQTGQITACNPSPAAPAPCVPGAVLLSGCGGRAGSACRG